MLSAKRTVRADLSALSDAEAVALLARYAPVIDAEVRRYGWRSRALGAALGMDDLKATAQIAALEAHLSWRPEGGRSRTNWVGKVIRWRLAEVLQALPGEDAHGELAEVIVEDAFDAHLRAPAPDARLEQAQRRERFETLVGSLSPRRRTIVACYLAGETFAKIAETLGVGHQFVAREYAHAIEEIRKAVENADDPLVR